MSTDRFYLLLATEARILFSTLVAESRRALDRRLSAYSPKISGLQYSILCALSDGDKTIADLSQHLARNPSTFVPAVDALERKGLVARGRDPDDRRRTPLALTQTGRMLLAKVPFVDADDPLVRGLQALGEEKVDLLRTLLRELLEELPGGQRLLEMAVVEVRMRARCPEGRDVNKTNP